MSPLPSSSIRRNATAMQWSAAAALIVLGLVSLPLLAQQQPSTAYGDYIISRFEKTGAGSVPVYNNEYVETSAFDFAAYFSNTCFRPTEFDRAGCEREFGPYWNLQDTLMSGQLKEILARRKYLAGAERAVVPEPVTKANEPKAETQNWVEAQPNDQAILQKTRDARAKTLWAACQKRSNDRTESGRCYRRNVRLLNQENWDLDVDSNVY